MVHRSGREHRMRSQKIKLMYPTVHNNTGTGTKGNMEMCVPLELRPLIKHNVKYY